MAPKDEAVPVGTLRKGEAASPPPIVRPRVEKLQAVSPPDPPTDWDIPIRAPKNGSLRKWVERVRSRHQITEAVSEVE